MKTQEKILDLIKNQTQGISFSGLKSQLDVHESTLSRQLEKLLRNNQISKQVSWKNTSYFISWTEKIREYLNTDFFSRKKITYNPNFLRNYIPNKSSFLQDNYNKIKKSLDENFTLSSYDYKDQLRLIETLLIDLSYASSKLEWNTYSYLDTEVLIKYGETPEWKTNFETQMIMNHKNVIKYIIEEKNNISLNKKTFFEIHTLLATNLIHDQYLGTIRDVVVKIWASSYTPLDSNSQLSEEFDLFLKKLNKIENPFEQSLFILVFIPYFQIFFDLNKRTSRIACNIPLISHGLPPLSLLQVSERDYIDAILWIYELNDPSLLSEIFTQNYLLNLERYI